MDTLLLEIIKENMITISLGLGILKIIAIETIMTIEKGEKQSRHSLTFHNIRLF